MQTAVFRGRRLRQEVAAAGGSSRAMQRSDAVVAVEGGSSSGAISQVGREQTQRGTEYYCKVGLLMVRSSDGRRVRQIVKRSALLHD